MQNITNQLTSIALRRLFLFTVPLGLQDQVQSGTIRLELGELGFRLSNPEKFTHLSVDEVKFLFAELKKMRGANKKYIPLFVNFPDEFPSDVALYSKLGQLTGKLDWSTSQNQDPELFALAAQKQEKKLADTKVVWYDLQAVSSLERDQKLIGWVQNTFSSPTPIQEELWNDLLTVCSQLRLEVQWDKIIIKETLARLALHFWQTETRIAVKTPTDFLRMLAYQRGQDVSLAAPISFKGLDWSKAKRREVVRFLASCSNLKEDLLRYDGLWISLSKWIHPGDYIKKYPKVAEAFDKLRNRKIKSFQSQAMHSDHVAKLALFASRPGVFLRQITSLLKEFSAREIAKQIRGLNPENLALPLLMTVYKAVKYEGPRLAIVKSGKSHTINPKANSGDVSEILSALEGMILAKLPKKLIDESIWIDFRVMDLLLPLQARKQSDGLLNLTRGSRLPINSEVIRLFVYWKENTQRVDLDLSAIVYDDKFCKLSQVSWNSYGNNDALKHSGDLTSSPRGATELIDIHLAKLAEYKYTAGYSFGRPKLEQKIARYVFPAILNYTPSKFSELESCYAGWMERSEIDATVKGFDPKTVVQKVNVNQEARQWLPFMVDLEKKELIYVDLYSNGKNCIESNPHFAEMARGISNWSEAKPTFGDLISWMLKANQSKQVDEKCQATLSIGLDDGCDINVLKLTGEKIFSLG